MNYTISRRHAGPVPQKWKWVSGSCVKGQMGHYFGWVTWVIGHCQWPIGPWWNDRLNASSN